MTCWFPEQVFTLQFDKEINVRAELVSDLCNVHLIKPTLRITSLREHYEDKRR